MTATTAEYGVLLKVRVRSSGPPPEAAALQRIVAALPGRDKRLTGGGVDFTVWFWVENENASQAVAAGAGALRAAARNEGIGDLQVIRSHSASVEGRVSAYRGVEERLAVPNVWSVYFKIAAPPDESADQARLERFAAEMDRTHVAITLGGDKEKFLASDGSTFQVRFWSSGKSIEDAIAIARADVLGVLRRLKMERWRLVRLQAATASARHHDTFPGSAQRVARQTEETS